VLRRTTGNTDTQDSPRPGLGGSHHLPPYSILCDSPRSPHPNDYFSWDSRVGVPKSCQMGLPGLWSPITLWADLKSQCGLKQSCTSCRELSNAMSHSRIDHREKVDSQLFVVGSQTGSSIPDPSFGHNLCFKCPNEPCKPNLDIYAPSAFQWYKERHKTLRFDPWNYSLKFWESTGTPSPKVGVFWILGHQMPTPCGRTLLQANLGIPKLPTLSWQVQGSLNPPLLRKKDLFSLIDEAFMSQPHFGQVWGWNPTLGKVRGWESSGTPECSDLKSKGQNTFHWGVLGVIGKVLKRRYRKWPRIGNSDICSPSYGQEKGRESNWQFDSRPLKVGNRPLFDVRFECATSRWKDLHEGYNFGLDLVAIQLCTRELWRFKVPGVPPGQFRESREFVPFGCSLRNQPQRILYGGRCWLPLSPGRGESCVSKCPWQVPTPKGAPNAKLTRFGGFLDADSHELI
jgi:hypothetical protein